MADNTYRVGGMMSIRVAGQQYEARGNFRVTGKTVRRTGIAGQDYVHGYIEEPIVPTIRGDWSIGNKLSIAALEQFTNITAQVGLANGMTYILNNAWTTSAFEVDAHDGRVEVTLEGLTMEELVSDTAPSI